MSEVAINKEQLNKCGVSESIIDNFLNDAMKT